MYMRRNVCYRLENSKLIFLHNIQLAPITGFSYCLCGFFCYNISQESVAETMGNDYDYTV